MHTTAPAFPDADVFCPHCAYNLRSLTSARCPECGATVDPTALSVSRIPWVHRARVGRIVAYFETVLLAAFRHTTLGQELGHALSYTEANRFRWITVLLSATLMLPVVILALSMTPPGLHLAPVTSPWRSAVMPLMALTEGPLMGLLIFPSLVVCLYAGTVVLAALFRDQSQGQRHASRAAIIALYASGPLIALPLAAAGVAMAVLVLVYMTILPISYWTAVPLVGVGVAAALAYVAIHAVALWRLLEKARNASPLRRALTAALYLSIQVLCWPVLSLVLLWAAGLVALIIASLW